MFFGTQVSDWVADGKFPQEIPSEPPPAFSKVLTEKHSEICF